MNETVLLDSSAVLACLLDEPGSNRVEAVIDRAAISAVNYSEIVSKLTDAGLSAAEIDEAMTAFPLKVLPFDRKLANVAGALRAATRASGLSLGDRACLATAIEQQALVITADRAWSELNCGVGVDIIR